MAIRKQTAEKMKEFLSLIEGAELKDIIIPLWGAVICVYASVRVERWDWEEAAKLDFEHAIKLFKESQESKNEGKKGEENEPR